MAANMPNNQKPETDTADALGDPVPEQKIPDADDKSAAGEEDPGAAIEEMHDPHPNARAPARRP